MLTQAELKSYLHYNPETGIFTWAKRTSKSVCIGEIAGNTSFYGYIEIRLLGKLYKAHRLAWLYVYGKLPSGDIDHINRIRNDNRIENIRDIPHSLNIINQKLKTNNTSGIRGVSWDKSRNKWEVKLYINGKSKSLGRFDSLIDAKNKHTSVFNELYGHICLV